VSAATARGGCAEPLMAKIRNPKLEIRNKSKNRNQKVPTGRLVVLNICFSGFGFVSDFELRISDFSQAEPT
jgi:hypothetical protein